MAYEILILIGAPVVSLILIGLLCRSGIHPASHHPKRHLYDDTH